MSKLHKVIYWVATLWLALGMVSTGIVQLMRVEAESDAFSLLGYPAYLMTILGIWKLLGVIAILLPRLPLLKEWAYAGFFFAMSGAVASHIIEGDLLRFILPSILLLVLTILSWYFRPADRKVAIKTLQPAF